MPLLPSKRSIWGVQEFKNSRIRTRIRNSDENRYSGGKNGRTYGRLPCTPRRGRRVDAHPPGVVPSRLGYRQTSWHPHWDITGSVWIGVLQVEGPPYQKGSFEIVGLRFYNYFCALRILRLVLGIHPGFQASQLSNMAVWPSGLWTAHFEHELPGSIPGGGISSRPEKCRRRDSNPARHPSG